MRIGIAAADAAWEAARMGPSGEHLAHSLERHEKTAAAVAATLAGAGHTPVRISVGHDLERQLREARCELVFNTYFGPGRRQDQASVAALMEYAGVPISGGGAACHFLGLDKGLSKRLLVSRGIPTPAFFETDGLRGDALREAAHKVGYPLIVKTAGEGEGIGIDERSVIRTPGELERAVVRVDDAFGAPPLVERFVPGRELTVAVLDGEQVRVFPILELILGPSGVYTYEAKTSGDVTEQCPAILEAQEVRRMGELAVRAGRALCCRDYWRVDFRLDDSGGMFALEVNTLPGLMPGYSDYPKTAAAAGVGYDELIAAIVASASRRDSANRRQGP